MLRPKIILLPLIFLSFWAITCLSGCGNENEVKLKTPTISSFTPESGPEGTTVTITGTNFSTTISDITVSFNGTEATVSAATSTQIVSSVPEGATSGAITVDIDGLSVTSDDDFTVTEETDTTPAISSFSPESGSEGTTVTINGTNFSTTASENKVYFNDTEATITSATSTQIITTVPVGATSGSITIEVGEESVVSDDEFTVTDETSSSPLISSFSPTSGAVGTTVTIVGNNYSTTADDNIVTFNGTQAEITSASTTQLIVTVPEGASTGAIIITVGGESVTSDDDFTVTEETTSDCASAATVGEKVVCLCNQFMASLSTSQVNTVLVDYTKSNAIKWSNLPGGVSIRNGIEFSDLSDTQLTLAKAVIEAASGTADNNGYEEWSAINAADDYLGQTRSGYSSDYYIIAFLGTPSTSGTWMLQFGGHHYAQNVTFEDGEIVGATPSHQGVEPLTWTASGTTYAPLSDEKEVMAAMLAGLSSSQLSSAKISSTFSDVLLGPGSDGEFPTTKSGLAVSNLSDSQKALVLEAIDAWVSDIEDEASANLLSIYESELDQTYIAYSGNASLTNHADYVRIDGPSVWIEFVCQNGVVLSGIHYHTIYRDHTRDYGGNFTF